jgi:hypothetical protein
VTTFRQDGPTASTGERRQRRRKRWWKAGRISAGEIGKIDGDRRGERLWWEEKQGEIPIPRDDKMRRRRKSGDPEYKSGEYQQLEYLYTSRIAWI